MSATKTTFTASMDFFHVNCPLAQSEDGHPHFVITSEKSHSGRVFVCCACGTKVSAMFRVDIWEGRIERLTKKIVR